MPTLPLNPDTGLFILRVVVGIIFIVHGLPKIRKPEMMSAMMPKGAVMLLGLVEILSAIGLIVGYQVRQAAALLVVVMLGATYFKIFKWKTAFWSHQSTGWEFDLILLAANLAIILTGGGSTGLL
ncbi:MAG: DoxX family protein [Candidatus Yanofskybacteria bacterium]|nr:DoxX family protein [Candidatus Yanofskybacteria bacterium]